MNVILLDSTHCKLSDRVGFIVKCHRMFNLRYGLQLGIEVWPPSAHMQAVHRRRIF